MVCSNEDVSHSRHERPYAVMELPEGGGYYVPENMAADLLALRRRCFRRSCWRRLWAWWYRSSELRWWLWYLAGMSLGYCLGRNMDEWTGM